MKRCRCMALDLDGTLLSPEGKLTDRAREALAEAVSRGVHVVIASGRAYETLPEEVTGLPGIQYAITSNGAAIYRVPDSERILSRKLRPEAVETVLRIARRELSRPVFEIFMDGAAYAPEDYVREPRRFGADARAEAYIRSTRKPCGDLDRFIRTHLDRLDSMALVITDPEKKKSLWRLLEQEAAHIYVTASVPRLLEISDEDSGKARALSHVLELLGVEAAETAAFGNGENDADMLTFAGYGVAVGNAEPACLAAADKIAAPNREDGAAEEIMRILREGF